MRNTLHASIMREAAVCSRMSPKTRHAIARDLVHEMARKHARRYTTPDDPVRWACHVAGFLAGYRKALKDMDTMLGGPKRDRKAKQAKAA